MQGRLQRLWRAATWLLVVAVAFDIAHPLAAHCSEGTPEHGHGPAEEPGHESCGEADCPTPAVPAASAPHPGHPDNCGCHGACVCHSQLTPTTFTILPAVEQLAQDVAPPRTDRPRRGSSSSVYRPPRA
jgi:hypothetical protein